MVEQWKREMELIKPVADIEDANTSIDVNPETSEYSSQRGNI